MTRPTAQAAAPPAADERWSAAIACGGFLLLITASAFQRIWAADFWWQLATGRLVASSGPPSVDVFSFTAAGAPWVELRWGYCWILHLVVRIAGFPGAVVLKYLAMLASFGLVLAIGATRRTIVLGCAVLTIALLASSQRFTVRPELATFLFLALDLWLISRYLSGGSRLIWALPVVQVLWVNLHTLFILGPLVLGLLLAVTVVQVLDGGRALVPRVRTLAGVLALSAAACLVNPYGWRAFGFAALIAGEVHGAAFKEVSGELRSPFAFSQSWTALAYFEVLIALALLAALAAWRRIHPFWTLLAASQLYLALTAIRNLPLFALSAVPLIVLSAGTSPLGSRPWIARRIPLARRGLALLVAGASGYYAWSLATDRFHVRQSDTNQFGAGVAAHRYPEGAARYLRERAVEGPIFSTMLEGGYLIAEGRKVFLDGRLEVYGEEILQRWLRMQGDEAAWRAAVREYDLRAALVDLQSPLVRILVSSPDWPLVHFDEVAAVFVRAGAEVGTIPAAGALAPGGFEDALASLRGRLRRPERPARAGILSRAISPSPYLRVAYFLLTCGRPEAAAEFAEDAIAVWPRSDSAHAALAAAHRARGDQEGAARELAEALRIAPGEPSYRHQLGVALFSAGRVAEALPHLEAAASDRPHDPLVWAMLTRAHADAGRVRPALECALQAARLASRNPGYQRNLGRLHAVNGQRREAITVLRRARKLDPADASVSRDLAALLVREERTAEARELLADALARSPADAGLLEVANALAAREAQAPGQGGK